MGCGGWGEGGGEWVRGGGDGDGDGEEGGGRGSGGGGVGGRVRKAWVFAGVGVASGGRWGERRRKASRGWEICQFGPEAGSVQTTSGSCEVFGEGVSICRVCDVASERNVQSKRWGGGAKWRGSSPSGGAALPLADQKYDAAHSGAPCIEAPISTQRLLSDQVRVSKVTRVAWYDWNAAVQQHLPECMRWSAKLDHALSSQHVVGAERGL